MVSMRARNVQCFRVAGSWSLTARGYIAFAGGGSPRRNCRHSHEVPVPTVRIDPQHIFEPLSPQRLRSPLGASNVSFSYP